MLNEGIDWNSGDNLYWKHDVDRIEAVKVILHGNAEFEAVDVTLQVNLCGSCGCSLWIFFLSVGKVIYDEKSCIAFETLP